MELARWRKRATGGDGPGRSGAVDACRGAALVAMPAVHARWDVARRGPRGASPSVGPAWQAFGDGIATAFLLLSGVSLALADCRGVPLRRKLRRLVGLAAVALAITAASWLVVPDLVVTCGIVHCLALGGALTLPFLGAPRWKGLALAVALLTLPLLPLPSGWNGPAAAWLGLGTWPVDTLDSRPLAPWAAFVPLGMVAARSLPVGWLAGNVRWWPLRWAGRHSLGLYLTHQAALYPILAGAALVFGTTPAAPPWASAFEVQCRNDCQAVGAEAALCRSVCTCVRREVATYGGPFDAAADRQRLPAVADACLRRATP